MAAGERLGIGADNPAPDLTARRARIVLAAALVALAGLIALEVADLARAADRYVLDLMLSHRTSSWTGAAEVVTHSGASPFAYPVALLAALVVGLRTERWRVALVAPVVLVLGVLSRLLLSVAVRDVRPSPALHLVPVGGFSFPSGHAAASALLAGALIWLIAHSGTPRPVRIVLYAVLGLWALMVGVTRLYLGVHWISDIVGSWLLAAAWLALLPLLAAAPDVPGGAGAPRSD